MGKTLSATGWLAVAIVFALHFFYASDIAPPPGFVVVDRIVDLFFIVFSLCWAWVALKGGADE